MDGRWRVFDIVIKEMKQSQLCNYKKQNSSYFFRYVKSYSPDNPPKGSFPPAEKKSSAFFVVAAFPPPLPLLSSNEAKGSKS